eukprot:TRINITY_DN8218_c0_g1_i1.p1 TRINITY_DN8218_c0_g1~~TRINITY_DN8218_c0_g1_i1.p1  ORF type:complete len:293 (-),score=20.84 TRINITY_DN8218_c0_g1_i1:211-1089(-)
MASFLAFVDMFTPSIANACRIYLNPTTRTELWANFGGTVQGNQMFPAYVDSLQAAGCEQSQYDSIVAALRTEFDERGISRHTLKYVKVAAVVPLFVMSIVVPILLSSGVGLPVVLSVTFIFGFGLSVLLPCALVYKTQQRVTQFNQQLAGVLEGNKGDAKVRLEITQVASPNAGHWVDSQGIPLFVRFGRGRYGPGGPPQGYNLVFACPAPVQVWPPSGVQAIQMQLQMMQANMSPFPQVLGAQVVEAAPQQSAVLGGEGCDQDRACHACGGKLTPGARFCNACGAGVVDSE